MSGLHADALLQQITEPRRRALELLVRRGFAFDSNQTSDGITRPRIYWQVRAWLEREGLVGYQRCDRGLRYVLTPAGYELCRDLEIES